MFTSCTKLQTLIISVDDCHSVQAVLPIGSSFYFDLVDDDPDTDLFLTVPHDLHITIFSFYILTFLIGSSMCFLLVSMCHYARQHIEM
jgi:hypothetical protein